MCARSFAKSVNPAKAAKAIAAKKGGGDDSQDDSKEIEFLKLICDSPRRKPPKFPEDVAKQNFEIGHRYNVETSRQHNRSMWDLQLKLDLKTSAMKALPPEEREWAMNIEKEDAAFPLDFRHPTWTPPIKGFDPDKY
eukprot:CAMPEP_0172587126 /NCGR_PEP_ID=MMETSP1068-20121228/6242_1 /TAXON_ID=35684 /ORGANISM="Pseudopedinella elastica, Strain CCMP716" /LENGTH=136 /DNA_ID=CAMNT_0013382047 /DNA_START=145 /DNA_END=555 /DNA_ORIENTATION=-